MHEEIAQAWVCDSLNAAAPLARHLFDVALEWTNPRPRKGAQLAPEAARSAACNFAGSPCGLFENATATLDALGAALRPRRLPLAHAIGSMPEQRERWLLSQGWNLTKGLRPRVAADVLLLHRSEPSMISPDWLREPLESLRPAVALAFVPDELSASDFGGDALLEMLERDGWAHFFLPGPAYERSAAVAVAEAAAQAKSAAKAASKAQGRRQRRTRSKGAFLGPPKHAALLVWRARGCTPPLYSLSRPAGYATAVEAAAVAAALARGTSFSEWFLCGTIEPLRPLIRHLFVRPRSKGKSVWAACFEGPGRAPLTTPSPCFWLSGEHVRGEHFVVCRV